MPQTARKLATEDVTVEPPMPTAEDLANLKAAAEAPVPTSIIEAMEKSAEQVRAKQSATRKANGSATTKPDPKPAAKKASKPKATAKPKASTVERVPAAEVIALVDELGITRSQLASAVGKSPSLVSEWVGKGRGHLVARSEWKAIEAAARKWAKANLK